MKKAGVIWRIHVLWNHMSPKIECMICPPRVARFDRRLSPSCSPHVSAYSQITTSSGVESRVYLHRGFSRYNLGAKRQPDCDPLFENRRRLHNLRRPSNQLSHSILEVEQPNGVMVPASSSECHGRILLLERRRRIRVARRPDRHTFRTARWHCHM